MISCKIFFRLTVSVFKEKLNLHLPLTIYSSIRFAFKTAFISEQIAENRFGALLKISDKFITKFKVFSYMILHFRLKTVWKSSKPYCMTLKAVTGQFYLKGHSLYHKNQGRTFRNEKRFEDKAQCLPFLWGNFFYKKSFALGNKLFWANFFEMFYMGTNDQIMQWGKLMVKRFQRSSQVSFSSH